MSLKVIFFMFDLFLDYILIKKNLLPRDTNHLTHLFITLVLGSLYNDMRIAIFTNGDNLKINQRCEIPST